EPDFQVRTEYGADAWKHLVRAGFGECRIQSLEYPAAQALVGVREPEAPVRVRRRRLPHAPETEPWDLRVEEAFREIREVVPDGEAFILVDEQRWAASDGLAGRRRI